ncbi:MAG: sigma-54-dependent Fis family transcriptional regulator, partial [Planctomycetes bacterium]|nr:sigma-54-dependent Fis family transcriptional regulator [Planctomycetota bacterium]
LEDFPESIVGSAASEPPGNAPPPPAEIGEFDVAWLGRPLAVARRAFAAAFERSYLEGLLRATRGRINDTAMRAGIDPRSLYTKMKRHGLRKEDFR